MAGGSRRPTSFENAKVYNSKLLRCCSARKPINFLQLSAFIFLLCLENSTMGNCDTNDHPLPIDTIFKLPAPIPNWPSGGGGEFASGSIDLGGLQVCQISNMTKIWSTHEGGPNNLGATFFEPSPVPQGFFLLGSYAQPNNKPLYGWILAGKDISGDSLRQPLDYTLVWSSESLNIAKDGDAYIWLPTPPDGYKPIGHVITTTPQKPPLDKIRCVRSDFTDDISQNNEIIWNVDGFNVYKTRPAKIGTQELAVETGSFSALNSNSSSINSIPISCLKNNNPNSSVYNAMPNPNQIHALFQAYSPIVYFHPDEAYLPSSVSWFFKNGVLLYTRGQESNPIPIDPLGSNLPQGGSNDGAYWIDLPVDSTAKETIKKGDLNDAGVYLHVKPMLGATFTDIAVWIFYPFNGPAKAKVEFINIKLGKIGEHVGDWEHVTLRISNFNGELKSVYFSQHGGGEWVESPMLEFQDGNKENNKPVTYSSLHGHAMYKAPGLSIIGNGGVGIVNATARSDMVMDTGARFVVVAAEHLGAEVVANPPWLEYAREWGPNITTDIGDELAKVERLLPRKLKRAIEGVIKKLPSEILGQQGPVGPKWKDNWSGDERS